MILNSSSCTLVGCLSIFFGRTYIFNKFLFNTDNCFTYCILIITSSKQVANSCTQTHYYCCRYYEFLSIEFLPRHYSSLSPPVKTQCSSFIAHFKDASLVKHLLFVLTTWAPSFSEPPLLL